MVDPLSNEIEFAKEGIGVALFERDEVRQYVIDDIKRTLEKPICIYESKNDVNKRYYFQFLKSTVFMCIVVRKENQWYLKDTLFNPPKAQTEQIVDFDKLIYSK